MRVLKEPKPRATSGPNLARAVYRQVIKILSKNKKQPSKQTNDTAGRKAGRGEYPTMPLTRRLFVRAIDEPTVSSSRISFGKPPKFLFDIRFNRYQPVIPLSLSFSFE